MDNHMSEAAIPLIEIENMTKVFYTDEVETHALSGVHLMIRKGEYVAMSGPSGCGKSTLLSIIGLLDTPTAGNYRLNGSTLFVTLEPCAMCAGAIIHARLDRLVFAAADPKAGAVRTLYQLCEDPRLNHRIEVTPGVLADECAELLRAFFRAQRALGKK